MLTLILFAELVFQPMPYLELRYEWVVGQTDWYTCGPAAVATLLNFFGIPTTWEEALELAEEFMRAQGFEPGAERGINALALKQTLEAKGIPTKGFRVKPEALKDFFRPRRSSPHRPPYRTTKTFRSGYRLCRRENRSR